MWLMNVYYDYHRDGLEVIKRLSNFCRNFSPDQLYFICRTPYNVKLFIIENNFNDPYCENFLKGYGYHKINRIAVNDFFWKST